MRTELECLGAHRLPLVLDLQLDKHDYWTDQFVPMLLFDAELVARGPHLLRRQRQAPKGGARCQPTIFAELA